MENSSLRTAGSRASRGCFERSASKPAIDLPAYPSRSPVGLHTLEGLPDIPFRDRKRLCLTQRLLLIQVGLWPRLNNVTPSVQRRYSAFAPTMGYSASVPRIGTLILMDLATWMSPFTSERQVLCTLQSVQKLVELRVAYMPDAARAAFRTTPELTPEEGSSPCSDIIQAAFDTLSAARLRSASLNRACRDHRPDVSATLTTNALDENPLAVA